MYFERFRCYFEETTFEVFTDNQVLLYFFTKPSMNRKEARQLYLLSKFGIQELTLKSERIHVLGDALSRAPHIVRQDAVNVNNSAVFLSLRSRLQKEVRTGTSFLIYQEGS